MTEVVTRAQACGETFGGRVGAWIIELGPTIVDRASLVDAMCHVMRAAQGCSACEFCDAGRCVQPEAHAAADLAMAYAGRDEAG